ncbi:MAG: 30S ribosomal protein S12 methylthiotransferase RimO [Candidatus Omnitrophica bacterium]|nr:30S ribosomal protein S12 methylthiotransferase RimO [Candidatus Omnitrophota bacterium]
MQKSKPKVGVISLGCPRNLVDSEVLLGTLQRDGFSIVDIHEADIGIVNTCAFIEDAKKESIEMILELAQLKKAGRLESVIVAGCMVQRYGDVLGKEFPEVDAFIGTDQITKITHILRKSKDKKGLCETSKRPSFIYDHTHPRVFITPRHYMYVKITEGCDNLCSYCVIPAIKGRFRSRTIESVLEETEAASKERKISEINLVGQDTTLYGKDIYGRPAIVELLKRICALDHGRRWIRLLYAYPSHIEDDLIELIAMENSLCKYIDLPIQHINDRILKKMHRSMTKDDIEDLIAKIREKIPGVLLRSSVIVGFPGETEEQFEELLDFIKHTRFDRLGVFTYSREESTPAYEYGAQLDEETKTERFDKIMAVQKEIAESLNESYKGRTVEVLIDEKREGEDGIYVGRTQGDAPEVDGEVFVKAKGTEIEPGDFVNVKITDTLEYDLVGDVSP